MRIGMMADVYKPHVSGITNYISLNKRFLEAAGHEVFVFTFGDEDYPDDETRVVRSPGVPLLATGYYLSLNYSRPARRLLSSMDLVHVNHPFLSGSLALRYCRPRSIPIVFTNHTRYDLYAQAYLPGVPEVVGDTALQAYMPVFCRACDLVIAPSPGMREVLKNFGVDTPVEVVPNGVDLKPFMQPADPYPLPDFQIDPQDVVMIYTGRLGPEKNLPFLLKAFNGVAQAYEHVRLLLVGDGPMREDLQERVQQFGLQERVYFTGMIAYQDMPRYLALADAFVTASVTEVHPLSVIEAMAASLPVLGIQSPGVGDTVEDGQSGFIVPHEDLASFTAKMIRLSTDHELRQQMGVQARRAAQAFSIENTTRTMLECYRKVVQQTAGRKRSLRSRMTRMIDLWR